MEKLSDFFINNKNIDENKEELPNLDNEEMSEVIESLGIKDEQLSKDVIYKTFRSVKEFKIARTNQEKESAEDNEEYEDYGTVRIKTKSGKDAIATLRLKKNDAYGTIIIHDVSEDDVSNIYDTMRIVETSGLDSGKGEEESVNSNFLWRAPEEWEVNIIALERGEWNENMQEIDAFRKYKKERPKLGNLFDTVSSPSKLSSVKSEEHLSPRMEIPTYTTSSSAPDLTLDNDSSSKKRKSKKNEKIKVKDSPKPPSKKERRWALFKKSVEARKKEQSDDV